jgi:molybdate transport system substrate-binding protein
LVVNDGLLCRNASCDAAPEELTLNVRRAIALGLLLVLAGCSPDVSPGSVGASHATLGRVRVAAASDLRFAMEELIASFTGANPGIAIEPTYGSSGTLFAQIVEGAPFDVYFAADAAYARDLETAGLAAGGSVWVYGIGQVVLWVPDGSTIDIEGRGLEALTDPSISRIAIANPEHAPYGRAAEAAMTTAGVYDAVKDKLVLGENVAQAAQFVESGSADIGMIAHSLALAPELHDRGRFAMIPIDSYPRLEQGAVVLASASDPEAARAFLAFVVGPDGRAVLDRYGFLPPVP